MITALIIAGLLFFPSPITRDPYRPQEIALTQWGEAWIGVAHNTMAGGFIRKDVSMVTVRDGRNDGACMCCSSDIGVKVIMLGNFQARVCQSCLLSIIEQANITKRTIRNKCICFTEKDMPTVYVKSDCPVHGHK